ncbi:MAG: methyltransferase domain-containing protein [Porphyromonadaceae bacterium]|nr:methyltransferase domain-containing protein [Porphyromonadaceae bacterium]
MKTDYFAERAAEWDTPGKISMADNFIKALLSHVELRKEWRGLEIGIGTGLVGLEILPKIDSLVGVDTSKSMLEVLEEKVKDKENVEIVFGELDKYVEKDIDFVFSNMSFHHIENIPETLSHLFEITNPGAIVAVGDIRSEDGSFHRFNPIPHKGFDTNELSDWFEKAGFRVKVVKTYNTLVQEKIPGKISEYEQFILVAERS